jgi:hypothetical protein
LVLASGYYADDGLIGPFLTRDEAEKDAKETLGIGEGGAGILKRTGRYRASKAVDKHESGNGCPEGTSSPWVPVEPLDENRQKRARLCQGGPPSLRLPQLKGGWLRGKMSDGKHASATIPTEPTCALRIVVDRYSCARDTPILGAR